MDHGEPTGQRGMCVRPEKTRGGGILLWFCLFVAKRIAEAEPGGRVD